MEKWNKMEERKKMKTTHEERQQNRTTDLMNQFFDYDNKWRDSIKRGEFFLDCHEWQILAANVIHDIDEEGLLHIAKEMYPYEVETINDWLLCYEEIASGAKI